jgi:hypothetical protein
MKTKIPLLAMFLGLSRLNAQQADTVNTIKEVQPVKTEQVVDKFNGNVELIKGLTSEQDHNSYIRPNTFYVLPADIAGYNWTEFYTDGTFFGKNTLSKPIIGPISILNQFKYGTGFSPKTGFGLSFSASPTKNSFVKTYFIPKMINLKGEFQDNLSITGFYGEIKYGKHAKISGFAEINLSAEKPNWCYGEINIEGIINDNVSISYNPSLTNAGETLKPSINHRVTLKYTFK